MGKILNTQIKINVIRKKKKKKRFGKIIKSKALDLAMTINNQHIKQEIRTKS